LLPVFALVAVISASALAPVHAAAGSPSATVQVSPKDRLASETRSATTQSGGASENSVILPPAGGHGLSSVEISPDLNCSMTIPDDSHGEFFRDTACATLVSVDGKLYGPRTIPGFPLYNLNITYSRVSQKLSGIGSLLDPFVIKTVVYLPGTGIELTQIDTYTTGLYSWDTSIMVRNVNVNGATHHVLVYRAADCFLGGSDTGFGMMAQGAVGCVSEAGGSGTNIAGSRHLTFSRQDLNEVHRMEGDFTLVWKTTIQGVAFPDTINSGDLDNGAGLSWEIGYLTAGYEYTFKSRVSVDPIMAGTENCDEEHLTGSMKSPDGTVTVTYDPRFLWPENDPKYLAYTNAMATFLASRAQTDRIRYASLGFRVPASTTIQVNCAIKMYDQIPVDHPGFTENAQLIKLRVKDIQQSLGNDAKELVVNGTTPEFAAKPWANLVDHELVHTFQYQDVPALWDVKTIQIYFDSQIEGDNTNLESGATAGSDLLLDRDDNGSVSADDLGSYLYQTKLFMDDPTPIDGGTAYEAGAFLQYLGEHYGDPNLNAHLEQKVCDFLRHMISSGATRTDALAAAMSRPIDTGAVSAALRDFMVAAYVQQARNLTSLDPRYWIYDEITGHDMAIGSRSNPVPQYTVLNAGPRPGTWPYTIPVPKTAFTPAAYELPLAPNQTAIHVKLAGSGPGPIQYAFIPMNASRDVLVNDVRAGTQNAGALEFDVPVYGATKVGVILTTDHDHGNQVLDRLVDAYGGTVTLSAVSGASNLTIDPIGQVPGAAAAQLRGFPIRVTVTNGTTPLLGIAPASFGLRVDGSGAGLLSATGVESGAGAYVLKVSTTTPFSPGMHTLEVTLGTASSSTTFFVLAPLAKASLQPVTEVGTGDGLVAIDGTGTSDTFSTLYLPSTVPAGDPFPVRLLLAGTQDPLVGATVDVTVTTPTGSSRHARLEDNGNGLDGNANDGTYGSYVWGTDGAGSYTIRVDATDTQGGRGVVQTATATVAVAGPKIDSDADGMSDAAEVLFGFDPHQAADAAKDADGDGLTNADEIARGTNPLMYDTDSGGESDGSEVAVGGDPTSPADDVKAAPVLLSVGAMDGRAFSVSVGSLDGQTSTHLWRQDATGHRVDLGVHPGTGETITDGPLVDGQYWYEAEVQTSHGTAVAALAGPYEPREHVTPPSFRINPNAGRAFANSTDNVITFLDVDGAPTEMRLAESETSLETAPWMPFAFQTMFTLSGTTDRAVYAQARDSFGLESSVVSVPVQFDTTAPVSASGSLPAQIAAGPLSVPFTVSDGADLGSGIGKVELWSRYRPLDSPVFSDWTLAISKTSDFSTPFDFTAESGRIYEFRTIAIDGASNREPVPAAADSTTRVTTTAPTTSIGPAPAVVTTYPIPIPFTVTDGGGGIGSVQIYDRFKAPGQAEWGAWYPDGQPVTTSPYTAYMFDDGTYEFYSVGIDEAGNRETAPLVADTTTILDRAAPSTSAGQVPPKVSTPTIKIPFRATDSGGSGIASVELYAHADGQPTYLAASGTVSPFTFTFDQGASNYYFYTIGVDVAGNREGIPCCDYWGGYKSDATTTYDPSAPQFGSAVVPFSNTTVTTHDISLDYWAAYPSGSGSVELYQSSQLAGDSSFGPYRLVQTTSDWPINLHFDSDGQYRFYTIAVDSGGGREDPPMSGGSVIPDATILIDTHPPVVSIEPLPATTTSPTITLTCDASDQGSGISSVYVSWRIMDDPYQNVTSWQSVGACQPSTTFTMPEDGHYEFATSSTDNAGLSTGWPPAEAQVSTYFDGPPASHAVQIDPQYRKTDFGMGIPVVSNLPYEVWQSFKPAGGTTFSGWTMIGTDSPSINETGLGYHFYGSPQFPQGQGTYEYYTIAVDPVTGVREAPPADQVAPAAPDAQMIYDSTAPTSSAGVVPARVTVPTISVPFAASDSGSGVRYTSLLYRYRANQDQTWGDWQSCDNCSSPSSSGSMQVQLGNGEGFYQFATEASDWANNQEPMHATGEAATHFSTGGDPSSSVLPLPSFTNAATGFVVPYIADFPSGTGTVDLYEHFQAKGATGFTSWVNVAHVTAPDPLVAPMTLGDGSYEFYTIATDGQSAVTEAAPATADASVVRDTVVPTSTVTAAIALISNGDWLYVSSSDDIGVTALTIYYQFKPAGELSFGAWKPVSADTYCLTDNTSCSYYLSLGEGEGTYNFTSVASDGAGNAEPAPWAVKASTILDTVPPTVTVTPLAALGKTTPVSLSYVASDPNGSGVASVRLYQRFLPAGSSTWVDWDDGKTATTSPMSITLSSDGRYEFYLMPCDNAGNCRAAPVTGMAGDTFTVLDKTAPVTSAGAMPALTNVKSQYVPYTASDAGSGLASIALQDQFKAPGAGSFGSWSTVNTLSNPAASGTIPVTLGADGTYQFRTVGTDVAGNTETLRASEASTVLDTTLPTTSVTPLAATTTASTTSLTFTKADTNGSGVASVAVWQRFQPAGGSMGNWAQLAPAVTSPYTAALAADGRYEFYLLPCDVAGNCRVTPVAGTTADTFTVRDASMPATAAGPLAPWVNSTTLSVPYTVTSGTVSSVELYWRWTTPGGTPSGSFALVGTVPVSTPSFSVNLNKGVGKYEFYTQGISPGNSKEAAPSPLVADAFTNLDTTAPTSAALAVTSPRTTNTVTITFTDSDNTNGSGIAGVDLYQRYTVPGGTPPASYTKILTGATSPVTVALSSGDGAYQFYTLARDVAGNVEAAPSSPDATTVLDTTPPTSSASALATGVKSTTLSVPFTANDAATSVKSVQLWQRYTAPGGTPSGTYSKVGTPGSGAAGSFSVTLSLGTGRYEFYTQATDTANNVEVAPNPPAAPDAFTVLDTTAPTSAAGPLTTPISNTSVSVPYTSADVNGSGVTKVTLYQSYEAPGSTTWSTYAAVGTPGTTATGTIAITLGSGSGSYRFYALATDAATNVEAVPSSPDATTVLDVTAPTSTVAPLPPSTSSAASISVSYSSSDNAGGSGLARTECWYRYKANDPATAGTWTTCGSGTMATGTFTLTFGSGAGIYDVLTVGVDNLGNREGAAANPPASTVAPKSSVRSVSWAAGAKVNTDTGSAVQDNASYAFGSDGTVYAVWEDSRNGNTDIYFSSRNPSTGVWAAETKLNTDTGTAGQRTPSIAIDGSNNLYVVWADDRNGSTNTDIYFAKRTGTTWSANIKVSDDTTSKIQSAPRISVSSAGIAVAVWYDARSSQVNIYSARLPAGSTTWSTNYNITTGSTTAVKAAPDVVVASDGTAWAAWQDNRTGGGDIYVASLGPTATAWGTNTKVSDDSTTSGIDKSPRIGLTSAGSPVVAYLVGRATNAAVRVVNRNGTTWNASIQVSDASAKPATGLALAVKADGGVIVAWDDTRVTAAAIWGAQCEAGSGTSSVSRCAAAEKWSDQTGASTHPTLVASTTKVYVGWSDATAGNLDIRIRLRTPS
jgi:hypothetical protein